MIAPKQVPRQGGIRTYVCLRRPDRARIGINGASLSLCCAYWVALWRPRAKRGCRCPRREDTMIDRGTTEKQQKILDVIRDFTSEMGYPPSVREIGERVGLSSSSTVQSHLKTLERRGLIRRDPTKPRALVPQNGPIQPRGPEYGVLPIVGKVAAGVPITAAENLEGEFVVPASFA